MSTYITFEIDHNKIKFKLYFIMHIDDIFQFFHFMAIVIKLQKIYEHSQHDIKLDSF